MYLTKGIDGKSPSFCILVIVTNDIMTLHASMFHTLTWMVGVCSSVMFAEHT